MVAIAWRIQVVSVPNSSRIVLNNKIRREIVGNAQSRDIRLTVRPRPKRLHVGVFDGMFKNRASA